MKIDILSQRLRQDKSALTTFGHIKIMAYLTDSNIRTWRYGGMTCQYDLQ